MQVEIIKYDGLNDAVIMELLSKEHFMDKNTSARDSVLYSVFEYQKKTDEEKMGRGVILKNEQHQIIGYMGGIFQPCQYKGIEFIMYQTSSAFITKGYPGNLSRTFQQFVETSGKNMILSSIGASLPSVIRSTEKSGFIQINKDRFSTQYLLPIDLKLFSNEYFAEKLWLRHLFNLMVPFLKRYFKKSLKLMYDVSIMENFQNDYTLIEIYYKERLKEKFVVQWNKKLLDLKFGKRLSVNVGALRENEVIHLCAFDKQKQIVGSMVVAKVRDFNKLMLIDIQTIETGMLEIVQSLLRRVLMLNYSALLVYGIEECYMDCIKTSFHLLRKTKDWRIYYFPNNKIATEDVSIVYSDDDVNY